MVRGKKIKKIVTLTKRFFRFVSFLKRIVRENQLKRSGKENRISQCMLVYLEISMHDAKLLCDIID